MKISKPFVAALAPILLFALSTTAVGQAGTSCDPGQIMTPCSYATAQAPTTGDLSTPTTTAPGDMETPTVASNQASVTEIAASVLLNIVSLF